MLSTILSVLLFVLKLIGFLLLFLLTLVLIILFVPVRYRMEGDSYHEKPIVGHIQITWFLHLINVQMNYLSKTLFYDLKIFGKVFFSNRPDFLEAKKEKEQAKRKKAKEKAQKKEHLKKEPVVAEEILVKDEIDYTEPDHEVIMESADSTVAAVEIAEEENKEALPYNPTRQPTVFPEEKTREKEQKEKTQKKRKEKESKKDSNEKKKTKEKKVNKKEGSLKEKKGIRERLDEVKSMMEEYQIMKLLTILKNTLFRVLKHILPRKLEGRLRFGLDDPGITGRITGYAAAFYPFYCKTLTLQPDFQEKCLEGDLKGSGRIRLAFFLWILITLLLKKEIRKLIRLILK
ncbi:MAG: DUF2953 domain-containing protein [Eubacteriales bacterium]|nr:DUF2953 domain-containing protein [Eubacteriales bacterium]